MQCRRAAGQGPFIGFATAQSVAGWLVYVHGYVDLFECTGEQGLCKQKPLFTGSASQPKSNEELWAVGDAPHVLAGALSLRGLRKQARRQL